MLVQTEAIPVFDLCKGFARVPPDVSKKRAALIDLERRELHSYCSNKRETALMSQRARCKRPSVSMGACRSLNARSNREH